MLQPAASRKRSGSCDDLHVAFAQLARFCRQARSGLPGIFEYGLVDGSGHRRHHRKPQLPGFLLNHNNRLEGIVVVVIATDDILVFGYYICDELRQKGQ